jgi:hypothetical protein
MSITHLLQVGNYVIDDVADGVEVRGECQHPVNRI